MSFKRDLLLKIAAGLFEGKPAPAFLVHHPLLQKQPKKVFPSLGLHNFREKVEINLSPLTEEMKDIIQDCVIQIIKEFTIVDGFMKLEWKKSTSAGLEYLSKIREIYDLVSSTLLSLLNNRHKDDFIKIENNKIKLIIPETIYMSTSNKKIMAGDNLFKLYEKIRSAVAQFITMPDINSLSKVKKFNQLNTPISNQYQIVFSSSGDDGSWDIATMSMRGIESCKSFEGIQNLCLIGDVASKYVGIIYLTSGRKEKYGEKMIKRCIVRFGVDTKNKSPVIILDKMYDSYNSQIASLFIDALQKRTNLSVLNFSQGADTKRNIQPQDVYIPEEKQLKDLQKPWYDLEFKKQKNQLPSQKENVIKLLKDNPLTALSLLLEFIENRIYKMSNINNFDYIGEIFRLLRPILFSKFSNIKNPILLMRMAALYINANSEKLKDKFREIVSSILSVSQSKQVIFDEKLYQEAWQSITELTGEFYKKIQEPRFLSKLINQDG